MTSGSQPGDNRVINHFASPRLIGSSPRSLVFAAVDPAEGLPVVIRELATATVPRSARSAFLERAEQLPELTAHPNVVTVYGAVPQGPDHVVTLEQYCPASGETLLAEGRQLSPEEVIAVGLRITEGFVWLHERGELHLDFTAGQLRFPDAATPCIAGVGLSRLFDPRWRIAGGVITPGAWHLAPELIAEEPASPATDLYSLASVLQELLTGSAPVPSFPGDSPGALCLRILRQQPQAVVAPGVPRALTDLLAATLSKDPVARPATAREFRAALLTAADGLGSAWTGRLAIPKPTNVLAEHDLVVLWRDSQRE